LRASLRGDIDQVVLKALHKEPARRYESAARLATDVENILALRPVSARPDSTMYRAHKFFDRHRAGTVVTGIAVLATLGGATAFTVRLAEEKQRAENEAARAREVSAFLVDLVDLSESERKASREITVREILDRAAQRVSTDLAGQPRLQGSLQNVIGQMYRELGVYELSGKLLDQSFSTLQRIAEDNGDELADVRLQRAWLYLYQGHYDAALEEAIGALVLMKGSAAADTSSKSLAMSAKGRALRLLGQLDEARATLLDARALQAELTVVDERASASVDLELGNVEYDASDFDKAREYYQNTINMLKAGVAGADLDLARAYMRLGFLSVELNDLDEAERLAKLALTTVEQVYGPDHPDRDFPLGLLTSIQVDRGDFEAAEATTKELLRNNEATYGPEHPETATILNNYGTLRFRQQRFAEAAELYHRAVEVRRVALGAEHPITAMTLSFEAYALHLAGDPDSETRYMEALQLLEIAYEPGHRYIANAQHDLGRLYVEKGQYAQAEPYLRKSLTTRIDTFGDDNVRSMATKLYLAACLAGQGNLQEAGELLERVRQWSLEKYGKDSDELAHANAWYADWLRRSGRVDEGRELLRSAIAVISAAHDEDYWLMRTARGIQDDF
jgi:tetratricopeptide (TPR) repeat protein